MVNLTRIYTRAGDDGTTRLWDVTTGHEVATMLGLSGGRWATVFPDGSYKSSDPRDAEAAEAFWWTVRLCRFEPAAHFIEQRIGPAGQ